MRKRKFTWVVPTVFMLTVFYLIFGRSACGCMSGPEARRMDSMLLAKEIIIQIDLYRIDHSAWPRDLDELEKGTNPADYSRLESIKPGDLRLSVTQKGQKATVHLMIYRPTRLHYEADFDCNQLGCAESGNRRYVFIDPTDQ